MDLKKYKFAWEDLEKWYKDNIGVISFYKFTEVCVFEMQLGVYLKYFQETGMFVDYEKRMPDKAQIFKLSGYSRFELWEKAIEEAFKIRNEQLKNK